MPCHPLEQHGNAQATVFAEDIKVC